MLTTTALALIATLAPTTDAIDAARFGPPWVSIEYPANPHHPSTRGATFLVHAYHHSTSIDVPVTASAEGLVDGRRVTRKLDVTATNLPGVYAVRTSPPESGTWLVAVTLHEGEGSMATALVTLGREGEVRTARVPSRTTPDGWVVPTEVSPGDIDAALRAADRVAAADGGARTAGLAGLLVLALVGVAGFPPVSTIRRNAGRVHGRTGRGATPSDAPRTD